MGLIVTSNVPGLGFMPDVIAGCGCAMCAAAAADGTKTPHFAAGATDGEGTRGATFLTQYRDANGFISYSGDRNIDAVLIGTKWTGTALTFSFPDSGDRYGDRYDFGEALRHVSFNAAQKAATRDAFAMISSYTQLTFTELPADSAERATIRLSSTGLGSVASAMGYFPATPGNLGGDIWFGRTQQPYYETPARGNWGYATIMHEIGHTMGLKHGHSDYSNEDVGTYFETAEPFYGTRALEYARDGQQWSIMSYTSAPDTSAVFNGDAHNQAQTYMMYDIAALQFLYGANYATNAGDSVYSWNPTTGAMSLNGVVQYSSTGNKVLSTVWDGGGNDTYDFSAYTGALSIDLRPGGMSTLPIEQRANTLAYLDGVAPMSGNIGNALLFEGNVASLIENAIGGSGNDRIVGNQAANRLDGGAGDDLLAGGKGSDLLIGGAGNDIADFADAAGGITIAFNDGRADILVAHDGERDVLRGIEGAVGGMGNDTLVGDRADNFLSGGRGGRDTLLGGAGNDTIIGAADTIVHADKADIVKDLDWYNHTMSTAIDLDGSFDLAPHELVSLAGTLPHATVRGTGPGGGVDYYRFTAEAGASAIFDLDGVIPNFAGIEILDVNGRVVASNFGIDRTDAGSRDGGAPFLEHVFEASGLYYIRVGDADRNWDDSASVGGFARDTSYVLNVSVESARVVSTVTATGSGLFDGGSGNDLIVAATGNDTIIGGGGIDTLSYANASGRVTVDLSQGGVQKTGASGLDLVMGVENLTGSRFGDTLKGNAGDNVINGGGGNDMLLGGAGRDTLSFAGQKHGVVFSLGWQGLPQNVAPGSVVVASGFENLEGGAGDDRLTGDGAVNTLTGGAGDDTLIGSEDGRNDGIDVLDGGTGNDIASFVNSTTSVIASLSGDGRGYARTVDRVSLAYFLGIEGLEGGRGDDVLQGDTSDNQLIGNDGNDLLWGDAGDDVLDGGLGDDILRGADGNDTAVYGGWGTHVVDLARTDAQDTGMGMDTLTRIENLKGGEGADYFFGNAQANTFIDVGGDDLYVGRAGIDTVDYSSARALVVADLHETAQQDARAGGHDLLDGIENLIGGDHGNILLGSDVANRLVGGADIDVLQGGRGDDRLEGGAGNDLLIGDFGAAPTAADGLSRNDVLIGGAGADRLIGGEGDDVLQGGSGYDILVGGGAVVERYGDHFVLESLVLMDGGQDTLDGGDGDDYGVLFYAGRTEAITIDNSDTQATNQVLFDGVAHGSLTSIETLRYFGGDGVDHITTSSGYDILQGGGGNDWISSGQGDDNVTGGAGNDWMDGGEGLDLLNYTTVTGGVTLDLRRTDAQDTGGAGIDTVLNFENIQTGKFNDRITGNDASNTIRDFSGGDDTFRGMGGSDSLGVYRQYGDPAVTIYLDGGDGSDVVEYYSSPIYDSFVGQNYYRQTDTVTLIGGAGRDGIYISGQKTGVINAGEGDDVVTIGIGGLNESTLDITLGKGGADRIVLAYTDNFIGSIDRLGNIVRDFDTGEGGDRMDLTYILPGWANVNPFAAGLLKLVQDGNDVQFRIDADGPGGDYYQSRTFMTFQDAKVEDFTAYNFYHTAGDGVFEPIVELPWDPTGAEVAGDDTGVMFADLSFEALHMTGVQIQTMMDALAHQGMAFM